MKYYIPSNGTEGDGFMAKWCENCIKDTGLRGGHTYCPILTNSLIGNQPKQWIYDDNGNPCCTSFVKLGTYKTKKNRIHKNQMKLL